MSSEGSDNECEVCECDPCECCDVCESFPCECSDDDNGISDDDERSVMREIKPKNLELKDVSEMQMNMVNELASILNIPFGKALVLLRAYKWSKDYASEKYMDNAERTLKAAGVVLEPVPAVTEKFVCGVCYDDEVEPSSIVGLACGHRFCSDCWRHELIHKINTNQLAIVCMHSGCRVRADPDFIKELLPPHQFPLWDKFLEFQAKNFVADSKGYQFCPSTKGCEKVFRYDGASDDPVPIHCECGFDGCWACKQEDHRPCTCEEADKWIKLTEDSDGTAVLDWIKVNCRQCPSCQMPISKNQGCNHMTCRKPAGCGHEFCWICLQPWSTHGTSYYSCNKFGGSVSNEYNLPDEIAKKTGQKGLGDVSLKHDWFLFHVQRYDNHGRSKEFALRDLKNAQEKADAFHDATQGWSGDFIIEGMQLVARCRHVLRWSYAYGHQQGKDHPTHELFEHQQTMLEAWTEALSHLVEQPAEEIAKNPQELKDKIASCRNFFDNMVAGWEKGQ